MANFTFAGGEFDVEGSLNLFVFNNLLSSRPTWAQAMQLNFDYPNTPLQFPGFAILHLGFDEMPGMRHMGDRADNGNKGVTMIGTMEIDCYVDATDNSEYALQIRQMADMVRKLFRQNPAIPIKNIYTSGVINPTNSGYIVRIEDIKDGFVPPDPNPTVKRKRLIIKYRFEQIF